MDSETPFSQIARALREALGPLPYDTEIFLALITPSIFLIIYLLVTQRRQPGFSGVSEKDLDLFEMVRLQKGLEQFDRDLLLDLAETGKIKPVYRLLLDREVYGQARKRLDAQSAENPVSPRVKRLKAKQEYLNRLQDRLFPAENP